MTIKNFYKDERGASTVEYALIAALIGAGIVASVSTTGETVDSTFTTATDCLEAVGESCVAADTPPPPPPPLRPSRDRGNRVGPAR